MNQSRTARKVITGAILTGISILPGLLFSNQGARPASVSPEADYLDRARVWVLERDGEETVWYADGKLKARGTNERGQREGNWEFWFDNGNPRATGSFKHNLRTGYWKLYHQNGKIKAEGKYDENRREGAWSEYYESGRLEMKGPYVNGKRNGQWINYYESGQIFYKGSYKENLASGQWEFYFQNGALYQRGTYENDVRVGSWNICIQPAGPCESKTFVTGGVPRFTGLPPAGMDSSAPAYNPSNPAGLLESMDTGPVPDEVPYEAIGTRNGWD